MEFGNRLKELKGDLIAGLTLGLTVIPQSMAYAKIAELPTQVLDSFHYEDDNDHSSIPLMMMMVVVAGMMMTADLLVVL